MSAVLVVLALVFLYRVRAVLAPFAVSFVFALLFEPFLRRAQQRGCPRPLAVGVLFVVFLLCASAFLVYVVPLAVRQATELGTQVGDFVRAATAAPSAPTALPPHKPHTRLERMSASAARLVAELRSLMRDEAPNAGRPSIIPSFLREPLRQQLRRAGNAVPTAISRATSYLIGSISSLLWLLVVPLVTLYMMLDLPKMGRAAMRLIPYAQRDEAEELAADIARVFAGYVRGVVAVAVMNGTATGIVLWLLGAPNPLVLGIIAGVLYPVPYIGALTSLTVACLVTLFAHGLIRMLWVLGAMVFLNQIVFDQIVLPRVLGGAVGLHPIISIFAMVAAGHLFGLVGVILAVPIAASIATVLHHLYPRLLPAPGSTGEESEQV